MKILVGCPTSDYKSYCLKEYAEAVKSLTYKNYDILLADNSKDNIYCKELDKYKLHYIRCDYTESARERIVNSRNKLREYALKNNYDYFLSLEQDVIPPKDIIERLLKWNKKVITGIYFIHNIMPDGKSHLIPLINILEDNKETMRTLDHNELWKPQLLKIFSCGLGCILIHRSVLEKVKFRYEKKIDTHDDRWFCTDLHKKNIDLYCDNTIKCKHLIENRPWKWSQIKK